jgi:hypothetical protein
MQSLQIGTHPRSFKVEPINNFVIFVLSAQKLVKICYFNFQNILTVDQYNHIYHYRPYGLEVKQLDAM